MRGHPLRDLVIERFLKHQRVLQQETLSRFVVEEEAEVEVVAGEEALEAELSLNQQRLQVVLQTLRQSGVKRVLDLGCGDGRLLELLAAEGQFADITGMDVSAQALTRPWRRLERLPRGEWVEVFQGSLAYRDRRLTNYDVAALVEVIEHLDPPRRAVDSAAKRGIGKKARRRSNPRAQISPRFAARPPGPAARAVPLARKRIKSRIATSVRLSASG